MKKIAGVLAAIALSAFMLNPIVAAASKNPYGTATIDPAGPNDIILTISKGSHKSEFAYPRLLKMKQSTITIYEPFIKKRQQFTVIPFRALFAFASIRGDDMVTTKALNDYVFRATASQFLKANAYLAIKRNGSPISYDEGGPIRIIFPDNSNWAKNLDAWNWSLSTISVK